jgi:hypothetical protein
MLNSLRKPRSAGHTLPFGQHPVARGTQVADELTLMLVILATFNDTFHHY